MCMLVRREKRLMTTSGTILFFTFFFYVPIEINMHLWFDHWRLYIYQLKYDDNNNDDDDWFSRDRIAQAQVPLGIFQLAYNIMHSNDCSVHLASRPLALLSFFFAVFTVQWDNKKREKRRIHDGMKDKTSRNMPSRRSVIDRMDDESNTCSLSLPRSALSLQSRA